MGMGEGRKGGLEMRVVVRPYQVVFHRVGHETRGLDL